MGERRVNVAIVGCGLIGQKRAKALAGARRRLAPTATSREPSKSAQVRPAASRRGDWRRAVDRDDVRSVIVATPHDSLAEITPRAIDAGKHVLVEKPAGDSHVANCDRFGLRGREERGPGARGLQPPLPPGIPQGAGDRRLRRAGPADVRARALRPRRPHRLRQGVARAGRSSPAAAS